MTNPMDPQHHPARDGFEVTPRRVVGALVVVLLIVFIAVNSDQTEVSFIVFSTTLPLWIVLAGTAALGVAVGMLLGSRRARARMLRD